MAGLETGVYRIVPEVDEKAFLTLEETAKRQAPVLIERAKTGEAASAQLVGFDSLCDGDLTMLISLTRIVAIDTRRIGRVHDCACWRAL